MSKSKKPSPDAAKAALPPATCSALKVEKAWSAFNVEMVMGYRKQVDEMATLIRKLVRCVRKSQPDNDIAKRSMDYLERHGLNGTTLRAQPNTKFSRAADGSDSETATPPALAETPCSASDQGDRNL